MSLQNLSDKALLTNTEILVARARELRTEILHHLREIERRRLYADLQQPSLFAYCVNILKYSNAQADRHIKAMRLLKELPQIEEKITSGELSLTSAAKVKEFFNQEEKVAPMNLEAKMQVVKKLENKSTREVEKILLQQSSSPAPEVKERIRQVSTAVAEVKFAADDKLLAKMRRLQGLLAHRNPNMKTSELIDTLCEIALDKLDPVRKNSAKAAANKSSPAPEVKPRSPKDPQANAREGLQKAKSATTTKRKYILVKIKKEVWQKAEGKCTNCRGEYALQIDHKTPISQGGSSEVENLRLLCRKCNQRAAITKIGNEMHRYLDG